MNAQPHSLVRSFSIFSGKLAALTSLLLVTTFASTSRADLPEQSASEFKGMYKIASSNDPIFPMDASQEWFLDFGKGVSMEKFSGSVAVSLRQNPNVRVRIMAWQYFPKQGNLIIGNPYSEGSSKAVAKGSWQMTGTSGGVLFSRENYRVVLRRADPNDY